MLFRILLYEFELKCKTTKTAQNIKFGLGQESLSKHCYGSIMVSKIS